MWCEAGLLAAKPRACGVQKDFFGVPECLLSSEGKKAINGVPSAISFLNSWGLCPFQAQKR